MHSINMLSSANKVKGQGVGSAYIEQVRLVKKYLGDTYNIYVNKFKFTDIMHYHTFDLKHYLMIPFARLKGVNVGYVHLLPETVDGSLKLPYLAKVLLYKYIISFYKKMDYLVTVNPYFIKLLENYKINRNKITYIPNFVSDKNFYCIDEIGKNKLREKYGFNKNDFIVLGVGQVQTRKGVMDLIKIAEKLKDVKFLWAGGFSFGRITAGYKELKKVIENPPPNVKFLGILDRDQMNDIYNISNLLFMPSYQELFPMTILEAFNCKVPILLRDLDIYPDVFFDYYLKGKDNEEFANEIERLKNDEVYCNFWGNNSWKGHEFYCEENVQSMWREFYNKVCKK
jgi:1,2-diacylglycerol-3-alpha-glucose alpha-1,2-galactosyltransferase